MNFSEPTNQAANLQVMGYLNFKPNDAGAIRRRPGSIGEVAVGAALRTRIIFMATHEALHLTRPRRRTITQHVLGMTNEMVSVVLYT
uniref:Uncharacterized protein n=1 Tax=Oryza punctata TaxID=4537 RepID=A0A0E0K775_ORYPU